MDNTYLANTQCRSHLCPSQGLQSLYQSGWCREALYILEQSEWEIQLRLFCSRNWLSLHFLRWIHRTPLCPWCWTWSQTLPKLWPSVHCHTWFEPCVFYRILREASSRETGKALLCSWQPWARWRVQTTFFIDTRVKYSHSKYSRWHHIWRNLSRNWKLKTFSSRPLCSHRKVLPQLKYDLQRNGTGAKCHRLCQWG